MKVAGLRWLRRKKMRPLVNGRRATGRRRLVLERLEDRVALFGALEQRDHRGTSRRHRFDQAGSGITLLRRRFLTTPR